MKLIRPGKKVREYPLRKCEVKRFVKHRVAAGSRARGATAGVYCFRHPLSRFHGMCFEKGDGQEGDFVDGTDVGSAAAQVGQVAPVDGVMLRLKPEQIQRNILKVAVVNPVQRRSKTFESFQVLS